MNDDKKYDEKLSLDLPFDEALDRFAQTDPKELLDAQKTGMPDGAIENLIDAFESSASETDDGQEFWYARDLQELLEYSRWENFETALNRAVSAAQTAGHDPADHFQEVTKMVLLGSGAEREIVDVMLSRYACYLIAQNADARKRPVAFAQTYFAIQTRRQEIADESANVALPMSEDEKRVFLRNQIKEHNKYLASAAKGAGVKTPQEFAVFQSHGYQGLYGKTVAQIQRHKGLTKSTKILDRMGSTELAANFFRVTQTEEKLRKDNIKGIDSANRTHFEVGRQVRQAMLRISGIAPEDLPVVDSIAKAEKRAVIASSPPTPKPKKKETPAISNEVAPPVVDLKTDLWKYALLVMVQQPKMEISTSNLIKILPDYIAVPDDVAASTASRNDSKFSQLVRNLKSHKDAKGNFINQGYAEPIPRGFRATEKGRQFVLEYFKDRL